MNSTSSRYNFRCIFCNGNLAGNQLYYQCKNCTEKYPIFFDIPYLYKYQESDILSLIEIFANGHNLDEESPYNKSNLKEWHDLLEKGLQSTDHTSYINNSPDWAKPWLEDRFREYYIFSKLSEEIDLTNKVVLDIGAGLGFDSYHLISRGANVTALEFSPFLARLGKKTLPEANWICGSASFLPFGDNSFDHIFCNATLHHVNDLASALPEMLRVLKVGGSIIAVSDSYFSSPNSKDIELEIFNEHQAVLGGINESIIDIKILTNFFDRFADALAVESISHISNCHLDIGSPLRNQFDSFNFLRLKYFENKKQIENNFDGLSFKINLKSKINILGKKLDHEHSFFEPVEYFSSDLNVINVLNKLTQVVPKEYFDLDLLEGPHNKFYLLNGLQKPLGNLPWRRAYKRLRLFITPGKSILCYSLRTDGSKKQKLNIIINGINVRSCVLSRKWIALDLNLCGYKDKMVIEFILEQTKFGSAFFLISPLDSKQLNSFCIKRDIEKIKISFQSKLIKILKKIVSFLRKHKYE